MGFWDKAKEAAKKAAEAAEKAKDKAVNVAHDQYYREDSAFNQGMTKAGQLKDSALGAIDSLDTAETRDDKVAEAKRLQEEALREKNAGMPDADPEPLEPEEIPAQFPNSMGWDDDEVYKQVNETMFPEFGGLKGAKRTALCEIARLEKKIVNLNRSIGSAYIETYRQLAESDDGYRVALQACGAWEDEEIKRAYRYWLEDLYDDEFYADDDGGRSKGERLIGWLVVSHCGEALVQAFHDAGLEDPFGLAASVGRALPLVQQRTDLAMKHFRPRRSKLDTEFLVQRGINADISFVWLDSDGEPEGADDGGSSLLGGAGLTEL